MASEGITPRDMSQCGAQFQTDTPYLDMLQMRLRVIVVTPTQVDNAAIIEITSARVLPPDG
jgi:hypothetical protein